MEQEKLVLLSTGHISEPDARRLEQLARELHMEERLWNRGYGFMMQVELMQDAIAECQLPLTSLPWVLDYVRERGAQWLLLDRDVETIEDLPTYDW
ncbi:hypothetical protein PU634_10505 [Oceanimonas pelagia]|uniref:DUF5983 domain-containing protein n=1 Tax=Oceanimonas pelagia TaxID=3028314 RepID=A0AA50QAU3_9GAMM|nr:hypothetical protein [Oceanimonas pelagia]WMC09547.1 hypothetical protein PU634_10505 [Oceanimonas pelagia]